LLRAQTNNCQENAMKLGLAALRVVVGGLFVGHGLQKLVGAFGGYGLEGTAKGFESMGLHPAKPNAILAGAAEAGGGALVAAGAATPLGASVLTATMATAIKTVHAPKGPWNTNGGYEYNLVLIAIVFALTDAGPGHWSVDGALGRPRWKAGWALAQLGAGLAGSAAALAVAKRMAPAEEAAAEPAAPADAPSESKTAAA
jgi:putative oxidoreductase